MPSSLIEYFEALDRLKKNRPLNVPKGTKITNDAVALEAGRGKGSIKKSRVVFAELIAAIKQAAAGHEKKPDSDLKEKLCRSKNEADRYRRLYEEGLARELSLIHELHELKQELRKLTSAKVTKLRD